MLNKRTFDFIPLFYFILFSVYYVSCESDSYTIGIQRNRSVKPLKDSKWSKNTIFSDCCGGIFRDKQVVIKSPRHPNNYPKNSYCEYIIYSPFVCMNEFHIQFLHFQLEPSLRCTKDKVLIGEDEVLCGQVIGIMKYKASNGTLRIKFISDETIENSGFELVVTRLPCSLNDSTHTKWNETTTISSISGSRSETIVRHESQPKHAKQVSHISNSTSQTYATEIFPETSIVRPICLSQTQTQPNQRLNPKNVTPILPSCCINIFNQKHFYLISPGFPNVPQHPSDCVFYVERNHANICRLRIEFKYFLLDNLMQQQCVKNFMEIDGHRFCGCKTGFTYYTQWGGPSPKSIRFSNTLRYEWIQGFILEIIQEECPYKLNMSNRLASINHLMNANDPRRCSSNYISWLNFNMNQKMLAKSVCIQNYG